MSVLILVGLFLIAILGAKPAKSPKEIQRVEKATTTESTVGRILLTIFTR